MFEPDQLIQNLIHKINRRSLVGKRNYALVYLLTHTPLSLATILDLTVEQFEVTPDGGALIWGQNLPIAPFWSIDLTLATALQDWLREFQQESQQVYHRQKFSQDVSQKSLETSLRKLFTAVDRVNFGANLSYVSGYQILRTVAEEAGLTLTPKTLQKYTQEYLQKYLKKDNQKDDQQNTQTYRWQYRFNLSLLSQASLAKIFRQEVELPAMGGLIFLAANPQQFDSSKILWIEAVQNLQQAWQKQTRYHNITHEYPEAVLGWITISDAKEIFAMHLPKAITQNISKNISKSISENIDRKSKHTSRHDLIQDLVNGAIAQFQPLWQTDLEQSDFLPNNPADLTVAPDSTPTRSPYQISDQDREINSSRDLIALLLAERRSENTRRAYAKDLQYFFVTMYGVMPHPQILDEFLGQNRFVAIGQVLRYKSHLIDQGLKEATVNRRLAALRALVNHAQKLGRCDWTLQDISSERIFPYRDTTGLPVAGIRQILAEINRYTLVGKRNYAILRLLWENALRRNEVITCNRGDFDPDQRTLAILGKGKGSQKSLITLSMGLVESIQDYLSHIETLKSEEPLFISLSDQRYGRRLSGAALYKLVRQTAVAAGVKKIMSPHRIRHSAITAALDATNGNVRKVQKLSRHKKIDTLMLYDDNRTNAQGEISDLLSNLF
jgi:integrase/recombinase XerC